MFLAGRGVLYNICMGLSIVLTGKWMSMVLAGRCMDLSMVLTGKCMGLSMVLADMCMGSDLDDL